MRALLPLLMLSLFSGCYFDLPGSTDEPVYDPGYYEPTIDIDVRAANLDGELGRIRGADAARIDYGYSSSRQIYVDLRADVRNGVLMNGITIDGDMTQLQPGTTFTSRGYNDYAAPDELFASVIGCSGPRDNQWDYDRSAERVTVEVNEGPTPDTVEVVYDAEFSDGSSVLGSLTIVH